MGIDIDLKGVSREKYLKGMPDYGKDMLEINDWMSLKNCTFLERLIARDECLDKEIWDAYKKFKDDLSWISKPFGISDVERAIGDLKRLDEAVGKMPFCPGGWEWMDEENKAIVKKVETIFEDSSRRLFVFPWDATEGEPMGSWVLQRILERALANMRKMPEGTVFFLWFN